MKKKLIVVLLFLTAVFAFGQFPSSYGPMPTTTTTFQNDTTNGNLQLVAGVAGQKVYVTWAKVVATANLTGKFTEGTGTNCGTGTADLTAADDYGANLGFSSALNPYLLTTNKQGDALCFNNSTTSKAAVTISFYQQ